MRNVLVAVVLMVPALAGAAKVTRKARPGDAASEYTLTERGDLFRQVGKLRCQITSGVTEFKVAQHPADAAAIYFVKNGDLKILLPPVGAPGHCPKAETVTVASRIARFTLIGDARSPAFVMTLDADGQFQAVGADGAVASVPAARDFAMNACHGQPDKKFSSYSAFVLDRDGLVTRLKGREAAEKTDFSRAYASLDDFRTSNQVCAPAN